MTGWLVLAGVAVLALFIDLRLFAPGREPRFREGVVWSIGWLVVSLAAAFVVWAVSGAEDAVTYTTVYFIERSLSLDNLFVFLMLFAYFAIPAKDRARLLFWGIVIALVMRGAAILAGVALIEQFHFVVYILGATLIILAYRVFRGVGESVNPETNPAVKLARRFGAGPLTVCLVGIVAADIAFAVDSIPAAFAITRDSEMIWMGNVFALLGLRALFVLVEGLIRQFRYLDETIAIVLGLVGIKLIIEEWVHIGPVTSLGMVATVFTVGIVASIVADRRDPEGAAKRRAELAEEQHRAPGGEAAEKAEARAAAHPEVP